MTSVEGLEDVEIRVTARCRECGGSGELDDPQRFGWLELLSSFRAIDDLEAAIRVRMEALGLETAPPEIEPCPEREGTGRIARVLSIRELGELIDTDRARRGSAGAALRASAQAPVADALQTPPLAPEARRPLHPSAMDRGRGR